jgi:hypothetical protein
MPKADTATSATMQMMRTTAIAIQPPAAMAVTNDLAGPDGFIHFHSSPYILVAICIPLLRAVDRQGHLWHNVSYEKEVIAMRRTAYGTYVNGQVVLSEPAPMIDRSEVVVVFLDGGQPSQRLSDVFSVYGAWEDSLTADETAAAIRNSRTERADICL